MEVNIYVEVVLTITRIIVINNINVVHQVKWHVDETNHHLATECDYWCWAPKGQ